GRGFSYKVTAGDATTPEYSISTRPAPLIRYFQVFYQPRPYTNGHSRLESSRTLEARGGADAGGTVGANPDAGFGQRRCKAAGGGGGGAGAGGGGGGRAEGGRAARAALPRDAVAVVQVSSRVRHAGGREIHRREGRGRDRHEGRSAAGEDHEAGEGRVAAARR